MAPQTYRGINGLVVTIDLDGMKEGHRASTLQQIAEGRLVPIGHDNEGPEDF